MLWVTSPHLVQHKCTDRTRGFREGPGGFVVEPLSDGSGGPGERGSVEPSLLLPGQGALCQSPCTLAPQPQRQRRRMGLTWQGSCQKVLPGCTLQDPLASRAFAAPSGHSHFPGLPASVGERASRASLLLFPHYPLGFCRGEAKWGYRERPELPRLLPGQRGELTTAVCLHPLFCPMGWGAALETRAMPRRGAVEAPFNL